MVVDFEAYLLHFNLLWIICGDFIAFIVTFLTMFSSFSYHGTITQVSQVVRTALLQYHHYMASKIDDSATTNSLNLSLWDSRMIRNYSSVAIVCKELLTKAYST